jgi:hypothetical protein
MRAMYLAMSTKVTLLFYFIQKYPYKLFPAQTAFSEQL